MDSITERLVDIVELSQSCSTLARMNCVERERVEVEQYFAFGIHLIYSPPP